MAWGFGPFSVPVGPAAERDVMGLFVILAIVGAVWLFLHD